MTDPAEVTPATDEEIAEYAADCAGARGSKCASCFVGPAIAGCASFLCRRDVAKLLARIRILTAERDEAEARLLRVLDELSVPKPS